MWLLRLLWWVEQENFWSVRKKMGIEEINRKYGAYEGNIVRKCDTKLIGDFYVPTSEPCDVWWDWEGPISKILLANITPQSNFLDVGANFGYFSLVASTIIKYGSIFAIEPNPLAFDILRENVKAHAPNNIVMLNAALTDGRDNEITFYWRDGANGNGRSYDPSMHDTNYWKTYQVKNIGLDFFADYYRIDVLKMDIEGAEFDALQNADRFFQMNEDIFIILEMHQQYIEERFDTETYEKFASFIDDKFNLIQRGGQFFMLRLKK